MPRKGANLSAAASENQRTAIARWKKENTDNLSLPLRKGKREAYKQLAAIRGTSVSRMIQDYMDGECVREGVALPKIE